MDHTTYMRLYHRRYPYGKNPQTRQCLRCGESYQCKPWLKIQYCSRHCAKFQAITKKCKVCGKIFNTKKSHIKRRNTCSRSCAAKSHVGKNAFHWKGGRWIDAHGYVLLHQPNHPYANKDKKVREHRLVMERKLGRYLKPEEVVHHINGVKDDNRRANLILFTSHVKHMRYESKTKKSSYAY